VRPASLITEIDLMGKAPAEEQYLLANPFPGRTLRKMPPSATPELTSPRPDADGLIRLLAPQMAGLDEFLQGQVGQFEPEIREMAAYCLDSTGKRLRPTLVFICGWRGAGAVADDLVRAAGVVEMVHLATLVHDDIMDRAEIRRSP
jgi:octaprenyl-diphosphate synthase